MNRRGRFNGGVGFKWEFEFRNSENAMHFLKLISLFLFFYFFLIYLFNLIKILYYFNFSLFAFELKI